MLTPDNYKSFAEANLSRPMVMEAEFNSVLDGLIIRINKNMSRVKNKSFGGNPRILINDVVIFFNYFNIRAATELALYLIGDKNKHQLQSVMRLLGVDVESYDEEFYEMLRGEVGL